MDLLTPLMAGVLLALFTGIQYWSNKGRFDSLERGQQQLRAEITGVRTEVTQVRTEVAQVRTEIAQVRADLLQVALAVGQRPHPQVG